MSENSTSLIITILKTNETTARECHLLIITSQQDMYFL